MSNIIQNAEKKTKNKMEIKDWINIYKSQIERALPKVITAERFTRIALTAISQNPSLQKCNHMSFIGAMLTSAQLGLEPNTPLGQAYLIPYGEKCQFQIGYKGLLDLAHRSGQFKSIEAHIVYENDFFEFEYGLNSDLRHKPVMNNRGNSVWAYAIYKLNNGGYGFEVMSIEDIEVHRRQFSKSPNSTAWTDNFEEMAKKTVIKRLLKYAPLKTEIAQAVGSDGKSTTINFDDDKDIIIVNEDIEVNNDTEVNNDNGEMITNE